jgi:uncharacterized damage-inducible protein DinB
MVDAWLRGPVPGVPALLQPVAHALIQAKEDALRGLDGLTVEEVWTRPGGGAGAAAVGFHAKHLAGALDRLFTYARGEPLTPEQRAGLAAEGAPADPPEDGAMLAEVVREAVDRALDQLRATREETLGDRREVGRQRLPTTVLGALFHGAEHAARHAGQLVTTARVSRRPA